MLPTREFAAGATVGLSNRAVSLLDKPAVPPVRLTPGQASSAAHRRAFTLIEVLLVLGLLGLAAAWVAPAWRGQLAHGRLESAAKDLRTTWQESRLKALEEATAYQFDVVPGTGYWRVLPVELALAARATRQRAEVFTPSARAGVERIAPREPQPQLGRLPDGVRFVAPWSVRIASGAAGRPGRDASDTQGSQQDDADRSPDAAPGDTDWVPWIVFEPSGRVSDARLLIEAPEIRGRRRLILRRFTGRVTIDAVPYADSETGALP